MKLRLSEIRIGECFFHKNKLRKKVGDDKAATFGVGGRVNTQKVKSDPEVEQTHCPLRFLAVGLRRHPDMIVEIGDGNPFKGKRSKGR